MTVSSHDLALQAETAQAAYALFSQEVQPEDALTEAGRGDFTSAQVTNFLSTPANPNGLQLLNHQPNDQVGFSATVFLDTSTNSYVLSIRGTDQLATDGIGTVTGLAQQGFAGDQLIALYRYYRQLTTAAGEQVVYSDEEVALLLAIRNHTHVPLQNSALIQASALYAELALDVGRPLQDGATGTSVIPADAALIVTGHSLGGHLALLFGRFFPEVVEHIYAFNALGIGATGERNLFSLGVGQIDPALVTNVAAEMGAEPVANILPRPGEIVNVYTEPGAPLHQHSIVVLADSLALYDAFVTLSPDLATSDISRIITAASAQAEESFEATLDFLRQALGLQGSPTLIAATFSDLEARESYYLNLYDLLDSREEGVDYGIVSLVGMSAAELRVKARTDESIRFALTEMMPFAVAGADFSEFADSNSEIWIASRADMVAGLLANNVLDSPFGLTGTAESVRYDDLATGTSVFMLGGDLANLPGSSGQDLVTYLQNASYNRVVIFGSDADETIAGVSGADRLFGGDGADRLSGNGENDILEGGGGADTLFGSEGIDTLDGGGAADRLEGGTGADVYQFTALVDADVIVDRDGLILVGGSTLTGGFSTEDGSYLSDDGQFSYALNGGTLTINGQLQILGFTDGDLGIRLVDSIEPGEVPEITPGRVLIGDIAYEVEFDGGLPVNRDEDGNPLPGPGDEPAPGRNDNWVMFPGTPGNDHYLMGGGNDNFSQTDRAGDDWFELGTGRDTGNGGSGNDLLEGGPDQDSLIGGTGNDVLIGNSAATLELDLADGPGRDIAGDSLFGLDGDDTLYGSDARDLLNGGAGGDWIFAGSGNDSIEVANYAGNSGPQGNDTIDAGAGADRVELWGERAPLVFAGQGNDDIIIHDNASPIIYGEDGDDVVSVLGHGQIQFYGGAGNDRFSLFTGADGSHSVDGGAGNDQISAAGNSVIIGGEGNDQLSSSGAGNHLLGGNGNDMLSASNSTSVLDGGSGNDTYFVANRDSSETTIHWGANAGSDSLLVSSGAVLLETDGLLPSDVTVSLTPPDVPPGWRIQIGNTGEYFDILLAPPLPPPPPGPPGLPGPPVLPPATIHIQFADGTIWDRSDLEAMVAGNPPEEPEAPPAIAGTSGADWLVGGAGNDVYRHAPGDGSDTIQDFGGNDVLELDASVSDVEVFATGNDYVLTVADGAVFVRGGLLPAGAIEQIEFSDGTHWTTADLAANATVIPANRPPEMPDSLGSYTVDPGSSLQITLPGEAISDPDQFDELTLYAITAEGELLPEWLSFDAASLTFTAAPGEGEAGAHDLIVIAADRSGEAAFGMLTIQVGAVIDTPPDEPPTPPTDEPPTPPTDDPPSDPPTPPTDTSTETPPDENPSVAPTAVASASADIAPRSEVPSSSSRVEGSAEPLVARVMDTPDVRVGVPLDPAYREMQARFDVLLQTGRANLGERYGEAVREFEERRRQRDEPPPPPPPTEEEVEAWNSAMHAWHERNPGFGELDLESGGGWGGWGIAGGGDRALDGVITTAPGLANPLAAARLNGVAGAPGLSEGLRDIR
jgi:Ca2+-binding RTX toxin-like protein